MIKSDRFQIINHLKEKFKIKLLCKIVNVSRSGYYNWIQRQNTVTEKDIIDKKLKNILLEAHNKYKGIYGRLRLCIYLNKHIDFIVNHKRVYRLMKELNIKSTVRRKKKYICRKNTSDFKKNILNRDFNSKTPKEKICMDITYIPIDYKKNIFFNVATDLYNNEIIAYDINDRNDTDLVNKTLNKLLKMDLKENCIIHTDQGFQYTADYYMKTLEKNNIIQSFSRKGNCWDNAPIESFFSHFKTEHLYKLEKNLSIEEIIDSIKQYIEFYNNERIQKKLKGLSPVEYKTQALI